MSPRPGPGPDVRLLAELDAGLLDAHRAVRIRAEAEADPDATAVLAALAATRAELAAQPVPPIPPGAVERWAAALRAEADRPTLPADPTPTRATAPNPGTTTPATENAAPAATVRRGPDRFATAGPRSDRTHHRRGRRVLAASALLGLLAAGLLWPRPAAPHDVVDLAAAGRSALGSTDLGALADPVRRAGCLQAAGVLGLDPGTAPIAGRRVELARGPAVLLVFRTGQLGVFDVVVVDAGCGPAGGTLLGTARIGQ